MSATENALQAMQPTEQRTGFSEMVAINSGMEVATTAAAAHAKAMVESRYIMAMRAPRNWDAVRQDLLKECKRPSFANNPSAFYRKPIGQGVEGLGIRFVEVALRCMKNVLIETKMVFEDDKVEVHSVSVTDLESNITYPTDVKVSKTVERSKPMDDGSYISVRFNSYKKAVYTVPANDDDLLNKRAALISKAIRTLGLRIIPGDLQDEAEEIIKRVRQDHAAQDPDAARRAIVDAFGNFNVTAVMLEEYLEQPLSQCTPAQISELRGLYGAIRDGEATWKTVMENKAKTTPPPPAEKPAAAKTEAPKSATAKAQEQAKTKPATHEQPAQQPQAEPGGKFGDDFVREMEDAERGNDALFE